MQPKLLLVIAVDAVVTIGVLGAVFALWKCDSCPAPASDTRSQVASHWSGDLRKEFADAFQAKDIERLKNCFCWDKVDSWTKETVEESVAEDLRHELIEVAVLPADSDGSMEYERNGIRFTPNLQVSGQLKVTYQREGEPEPGFTSYLLGHKDGRQLISLAAPSN